MKEKRARTPFGQRMLEARENAKPRKLTQIEVCEHMGISQGTLSELERSANGSGRTVEFADLYDVSAKWLATGEGKMRAPTADAPPPNPPKGFKDRYLVSKMDWDFLQALEGIPEPERVELRGKVLARAKEMEAFVQEQISKIGAKK